MFLIRLNPATKPLTVEINSSLAAGNEAERTRFFHKVVRLRGSGL